MGYKLSAIDQTDIQEYRKNITNKISDLQYTYYKLYKLNLKYIEIFGKCMKKVQNLVLIRNNIIQLKDKLTELDEIIRQNKNIKKHNHLNLPILDEQIIELDFKYKIKTYILFNNLMLENDSTNRKKIINELICIYENVLKNIIVNDKTSNEKDKTKNQIIYLIRYLKKILKIENDKLKKQKDSYISKPSLNLNFLNYESYVRIMNGESTDEYSLLHIMQLFRDIIRNSQINYNLIKCADDIIDRFFKENINDEIYTELLYSIIDSLKYRKIRVDKNDKSIQILNTIIKKFKYFADIIRCYTVDFDNESSENLYDIIITLLYDESGYLLIKKILEYYPDIVNSKFHGDHIIEYIASLYLKNYEKLINENKSDYIDINYLREVYYLFINNPNLLIDDSINQNISNQVNNFIERITTDIKSSYIILNDVVENTIFVKNQRRKSNIVEEVTNVLLNSSKSNKKYEIKEINANQLNNEIQYINKENYIENNYNTIDLTEEENIILDDYYIAYNFKKTSSSSILRISVPDISYLIPKDSMVDRYLYNKMLNGKKIDDEILNKLKFQEGKKVPAITFKISLDKNNKPIDLYIYKSIIVPKKVQHDSEMYYKLIQTINNICDMENYIVRKSDIEKIKFVSKNLLNDLYLKMTKDKKIPFIYSGIEKVASIKPKTYMNLVPILNKMPKQEVKNIYDLLTSNLGEFHYSDKPFNVEDEYELNLIGEPNYLLLENQRIIKSLILSGYEFGKEQYDNKKNFIISENNNMISELNKSVNYKNVYSPTLTIKKNVYIPN